ncbi:MFS transporter [Buchananella hordeovulneris]|uniref:MFS transporter n=1 Tax=Buchananella hordeovulneris TaxID=52770 RepID=UPI000F5DE7C2|nr:MFS transporter [Buchananella hordeovulneris]RRD52925.1 MFS transporter [Buchananella hordeovulneris]
MAKTVNIPGWGHYRTARVARALVLAWPVMTLVLQAKGLSFAQIGLLNSFGAIVALCAEVPAGMLADRCGHRHSLVVSNVLLALGMLVLALAESYWGILVSELLLSVGLAAGTGSDSALLFRMHQQAGKTERYAQSLATIRQLLVLVALVPALVAPALFAWGAALPVYVSVPLYCLAAYCFAGITVSARVPVAPPVADIQPAAGDADTADSRWARLARRGRELVTRKRRFLAIAVLAMLAGIAVSNYGQFVNPFLVSLGFQTQFLGVVLVVGTGCAWLGNWLAPRLLARQRAAGVLVPLCVASIGLVVALNAVPFGWGGAVVLYGVLRLLASVLGVVRGRQDQQAGYRHQPRHFAVGDGHVR